MQTLTNKNDTELRSEILNKLNYNPLTGIFTHKKSGKEAGTYNCGGYRQLCVNQKQYMAHRVAYLIVYGYTPEGLDVHHRNHIRDDNRIENLEKLTHRDNLLRRGSWSSTGRKGVSYNKISRRYVAQLTRHDKNINLGTFKTANEASDVYESYVMGGLN